jgi:signal transduction histidine kinase
VRTPDVGSGEGRTADAGPGRDQPDEDRPRQLADEQAALRRVATLVAGGARPAEVFMVVADELGRLIGAEATFVSRVDLSGADSPGASGERAEPEGYITVVGSYGRIRDEVPVGFRVKLTPGMVMTAALRTGGPARINGERLANGPFGAIIGRLGLRAAVATPIVAGGHYWGLTVAATSREDFPAGTESRMAEFVELAGMAIANAEAEQKLRELADTQASLRRLAMLVARGEPPEVLFAAVTKEVQRYFGGGTARMVRYEVDGTATLLANAGTESHVRVGGRWEGYPPTGLTVTVRRTGRAARIDDYRDVPGAEVRLREGILSSVALPIHVNGQLWGMIAVGSGQASLPPDTEQRMTEFTELVATAVANAQSRAELITSRARIVAASDEVRRRIERDLHDGAQQRLVTLALRLRSAAEPDSGRAELGTEIAGVAAELMGVIDDLREISSGIHPAILSKAGLRPALRALGRRSAVPVELDVQVDGRLPEPVEVGAYYVVSEMLANAAKHARASMIQVDAETSGGTLWVRVHDDGIGGATPARGSGLLGLKDRIEALGGTFSVHSPAGHGTTVSCQLPLTSSPP